MERVRKLREVLPSLSQITHTEFYLGHSRRYRRCFVACFVFLFFLCMLYYLTREAEADGLRAADGKPLVLGHLRGTTEFARRANCRRRCPLHSNTALQSAPGVERELLADGAPPLVVSVPGWSPNTSRDLKLYVLPEYLTAIIPGPDICSEKLFLLIVVCSAVNNFEDRSAIRQTWASVPLVTDRVNAIRVAFLLGETENNTLQVQVEEESDKYSDIIQEGFLDTYNNLTIKSVMLLKWTIRNCPSVRYIMKTDDDTFVNIKSLVRLLLSKDSTGLLMGSLIMKGHPRRKAHSRWYAPKYMYPGREYPNYLSGTGYVMSKDVVEQLYKAALQTQLFHLEDVYVTGLCSKAAGIRPRNHPAFSYKHRPIHICLLRDDSVVTSHRMKGAQLLKIWPGFRDPNIHCPSINAPQNPSPAYTSSNSSLRIA